MCLNAESLVYLVNMLFIVLFLKPLLDSDVCSKDCTYVHPVSFYASIISFLVECWCRYIDGIGLKLFFMYACVHVRASFDIRIQTLNTLFTYMFLWWHLIRLKGGWKAAENIRECRWGFMCLSWHAVKEWENIEPNWGERISIEYMPIQVNLRVVDILWELRAQQDKRKRQKSLSKRL